MSVLLAAAVQPASTTPAPRIVQGLIGVSVRTAAIPPAT